MRLENSRNIFVSAPNFKLQLRHLREMRLERLSDVNPIFQARSVWSLQSEKLAKQTAGEMFYPRSW